MPEVSLSGGRSANPDVMCPGTQQVWLKPPEISPSHTNLAVSVLASRYYFHECSVTLYSGFLLLRKDGRQTQLFFLESQIVIGLIPIKVIYST